MRSRARPMLAALLLSLCASSVSSAETALLRWTHSGTTEVMGFQISMGYSSRNYDPQLELNLGFSALTPQNGIYQVVIEIDETRPVYVALRAYNDDETSVYSNERVFTTPLGVPGRPRLTD